MHRLGGYGIPAIPTQPTKLSSHRTLRSLTICEHLCASVGGSSPPEASVCSVISVGGLQCWCTSARLVQQRLLHPLIEHLYSVNSVGEPYAAKPSVRIRGRLFSARSFCVFCEFRGRITMLVHECSVGAAETAAPPGGKTQRGHGGMPCPLMSLFCGCTVCLVSAAETAAPPECTP